jgi:FkbM family methyltransferase
MQNSINPRRRFVHSLLRSAGIQASRISPYTNDQAALSAMLKHANVDLILDVGANVGQYAKERFAKGYKGRLVSFEPLSGPRSILVREAARYTHWDIADQCALGDHEGTVTLHVAEDSEASSVLQPTKSHLQYSSHAAEVGTEIVAMARLDRVAQPFLQDSQAPFLKIDVQGFEDQVLQGSTMILPKLVGLQIELSIVAMYDGQKLFPEMLSMINAMGFALHRMIPAWIEQRTGRWLQADGIFFRPS